MSHRKDLSRRAFLKSVGALSSGVIAGSVVNSRFARASQPASADAILAIDIAKTSPVLQDTFQGFDLQGLADVNHGQYSYMGDTFSSVLMTLNYLVIEFVSDDEVHLKSVLLDNETGYKTERRTAITLSELHDDVSSLVIDGFHVQKTTRTQEGLEDLPGRRSVFLPILGKGGLPDKATEDNPLIAIQANCTPATVYYWSSGNVANGSCGVRNDCYCYLPWSQCGAAGMCKRYYSSTCTKWYRNVCVQYRNSNCTITPLQCTVTQWQTWSSCGFGGTC
jgi:hypothetical protein